MSTINPFKKDIIKVETDFCGKKLSLEINRVGFRASASVIARYGDTVVLGTAMVGNRELKGFDYFPLSIDYEEKMYAAGKISGSRFIKREGRPSDDAILIGRLIDRPIRPLWPKGYRHEAQGVASVLSMDPDFRPDAIAMIAVSTAFMLTGAPFEGPVAGVRVGIDDKGDFTTFGTATELNDGKLDLFVAGTDKAIMMVEAGANEVSETEVTKALQFAFDAMQPAIELQKELVEKIGVTAQEYNLSLPSEDIQTEVNAWLDGKMGDKIRTDYPTRHEKMHELREALMAHFEEKLGDEFEDVKNDYQEAFASAANKDVRKGILEDGLRPDGRGFEEIRQLSSEVGFLPRAHGSSLFTRGMTQGMNIVTLAPLSYSQIVDTMEFDKQRRFLHHYNAPGYTIGEVKRLMGPGRREIGHGYLAERALLPVIPSEEEFPYTIRTVTEIMSQHGSTSMAATCSSCLALMDAGVPIKNPVSGIAMGLMKDGDKIVILSDIADAEDFAGDMDFKVTGTKNGITALQMDMKVHGLGIDVLSQALEQGKAGRAKILEHMLSTIAEPRKELSPHAPRIDTITINPERIRDVIGKGGETINKIIAETGAEIDIKDDGTVMISSSDGASREKAVQWVKVLTEDPEVGKIYKDCRVVSILDFGIFVEILPGREGLVHVSELSEKRVEKVTDFIKEGEKVTVKLVAIDEKGRLNLSMKAVKKEG
ncbi:MAG TPA: polyribonucleotide nucleotidyltransferase [Candidatus Saccharibacteria bacterium]|nr:polyribonucleotide nucleotidyltransferase [Candidatus Saccharibacteria bacterium]